MAIQAMNEYRITQENGESIIAVYGDAKQAIAAFDTELNPVTQLVRTKVGIQVGIPDTELDVNFRTIIAGSGAESAGCRATPSTFEVAAGSSVIFEAFAAEGYHFMGWFLGTDTSGTPQSISAITAIVINAEIGVSQDVVITALFAPITA